MRYERRLPGHLYRRDDRRAGARLDEAVPAFLTVVGMPFTYSIANGIALGIVSWVAIKLLTGRWRETHAVMIVLAVLLVLYYAFLHA